MSRIEYVQAASPRKLPFIHSNFKPRSKFAKTFRGCSLFSKLRRSSHLDEEKEASTLLPRITYEAEDMRNEHPAFGSVRRGARREYPGFTGQARILRARRRLVAATSTPNIAFMSRNGSRNSEFIEDDGYLVFDSPRSYKDSPDYSDLDSSLSKNEWSRLQSSAQRRINERLGNVLESAKHTSQEHDDASAATDPKVPQKDLLSDNLDSLFICDDADEEKPSNKETGDLEDTSLQNEAQAVKDGAGDCLEGSDPHAGDSKADDKLTGPERTIRFADREGSGKEDCEENAESHPFTRSFEEKLRELRGKSGVKRDRERRGRKETGGKNKRREFEPRPLGDVITNKRLSEILLQNDKAGSLTLKLHS